MGYQQLYSLVDNFFVVKYRCPDVVHVAEFGVGRGGSAAVLGWLVEHYGGTLTLYDVFGRIPSPSQADGERASQRYETIINEETEDYYGNILNLQALIEQELSSICDLDKIEFISGRYEEKLDELDEKRSFDLVHIDCDWYENVRVVLSYLRDNISPDAISTLAI